MADAKQNPEGFFSEYLNGCAELGSYKGARFDANLKNRDNTRIAGHIESRTRKMDVTEALRFRIHDPLWMLTRQWQLGEFRGNDAGTAMSVRCHVASTPISGYGMGNNSAYLASGLSNDTPIEPVVEQVNRVITPLVRVESAAYFCTLFKGLPQAEFNAIIAEFRKVYPLKDEMVDKRASLEVDEIRSFSGGRNTRLQKFARAFSSRAFDGYALYQDLSNPASMKASTVDVFKRVGLKVLADARKEYLPWFANRYLPKDANKVSAWNVQDLGYDFTATNSVAKYKADDYVGGRVSWYSFDVDSMKDSVSDLEKGNYKRKDMRRETIDSLPVLASYPGSPNKRLWEFENKDVFMGNSKDMQAKGNVAFMQFATMYGNDWMLCPLKTEIGQYIEVESIEVYDTFGIQSKIRHRAGLRDKGAETFGQRWQMFTNTPVNLEVYDDLTTKYAKYKERYANGLLFPPALVRTLEGEPLEEVSLLRDEMANMVWGVETRIEDGCGSSLDANLLASEVEQYMEDKYAEQVEEIKTALTVENVVENGKETTQVTTGYQSDYKYSLMTSVPLNWIPFVPQRLKTKEERAKYAGFQGGRETILRRGKMPYFFKDGYYPVRPLSSILKVETEEPAAQPPVSLGRGVASQKIQPAAKVKEKPLFINEEEVQGVGSVIRKNCQRSRWLNGQTFTWMGYTRQIKYTQGVSGLEFDNLLDPTR